MPEGMHGRKTSPGHYLPCVRAANKIEAQQKKCLNCGYTNHTEPECFRPGGPLHKAKQKDFKKKKNKGEKAHAAEADKSTTGTDSSSSDMVLFFCIRPARTMLNA